MKTRLLGAVAVVAVLSIGACAPTSRFEWGAYEGALYAYSKKPDRREAYRTALQSAIARGQQTNRVAPGLNAELGYLYLEDGDVGRAVTLFNEEMRLFPESRPFLSSIVSRATEGTPGSRSTTAGAAQ